MKLKRLASTLRKMAKAPSRVSAPWAQFVWKEIRRSSWDIQISPDGDPWAALAASTVARKGAGEFKFGGGIKSGGAAILRRSGDMFGNASVKPLSGAGIVILMGAAYAKFHQRGTRHMPARKVLPEGNIPASWRTKLAELIAREYREALR